MNSSPLTVQAAAGEIVALINSRSSSPRLQELETIIGRVSAPGHASPLPTTLAMLERPIRPDSTPLLAEYLLRWSEHDRESAVSGSTPPDAPNISELEARTAAAEEPLNEVIERVWARSPRSWEDVCVRALIYADL